MLLSDFLSEDLGATGTHVGCKHGVCGACTVQIDGVFVCMPRFDTREALALIEAARLTCPYLVPTSYHDLLTQRERAGHGSGPGGDFASVKKLGFAGAPMHDALLKRLQAAFEPEFFVNHYGSSEVYTFSIDQQAPDKPGSAGEVAVAGLSDERWEQRVVAFVTTRDVGAALDAHCRSSGLPNFKRPREYVFVAEIPKSPVGKVLRRKLEAGEYTLLQTDENPSA